MEEKPYITKKIKTSDNFSKKEKIVSTNKNIKKVKRGEIFNNNNEIIKENIIKEEEQKNKKKIENSNDFLNIKDNFNELQNIDNDEIKGHESNEKEKNKIEKLIKSEKPKKSRNANSFAFSSNFNFDFEPPSEKNIKDQRRSINFGVYRMNFKKVVLKKSKKNIASSIKKRTYRKIFKHLIKNIENKSIKKYFNLWKNIDNIYDSDKYSDNDDEDLLEIIKTNEIKFINRNNKQNNIKTNEKKVNEKKNKKSCLNGIYGLCFTQDFINNKNKEEYVSIYGNEKSKEISDNIQPHFSNFLKAINCSIATFNLFTYYTQFHDKKFLLKKKFLPIWRKVR